MLVSNDGDFVEQVGDLLDGRRVGVIGFVEFRNTPVVPLAERGLELTQFGPPVWRRALPTASETSELRASIPASSPGGRVPSEEATSS